MQTVQKVRLGLDPDCAGITTGLMSSLKYCAGRGRRQRWRDFKGRKSTTPTGTNPFVLIAPLGLVGPIPSRPPGTLRIGGTQFRRAPRYPEDSGDSVPSVPKVHRGLVGLSPFNLPGTLETGGTQSFQAPGYP